MPLTKLKEAILNKNNEPNVLFISGAWGSGKTTFVRNTLAQKYNTKAISYISCFGIDSLNQLKSDISSNKKNITSLNRLKKIWRSSDVIMAFLKAYKGTYLSYDISKGVKSFLEDKASNLKILFLNFFRPYQSSPLKQLFLVLPKCIFSFRDWSKSPIRWLLRFLYASVSVIYSLLLTNLRDIAPILDGITLNLGAIYNKLSFQTVRNCTIIIDDIERKSDNLKIKEVLGLVSFLREERGCSVVLIMGGNDKENNADKKIIDKYREKVLEKEFQFMNTVENCYDYAEPSLGNIDSDFKCYLLPLLKRLDCQNIRLISKIKLIINTISENKSKETTDLAELISTQVVLTILGTFRPNEYKFEELGFSIDQDLSDIINLFLMNTITKEKHLQDYFNKKYFEEENAKTRTIFQDLLVVWRSSLTDNSEKMKHMLEKEALPFIENWIPSELYNALFYLDHIEDQALAKVIVNEFEMKNSYKEVAFNPKDDGFGNKGYPVNQYFLSVASQYKKSTTQKDFKLTMDDIFQNEVLRKGDLDILESATVDDVKNFLLSYTDKNLSKKFRAYISFISDNRKILTDTKDALVQIGEQSKYQKVHADHFLKQVEEPLNRFR